MSFLGSITQSGIFRKPAQSQRVDHAATVRQVGKSLALGLTWFIHEGNAKQRAVAARQQMIVNGDDLYCTPDGGQGSSPMFGMTNRLSGMRAKSIAAAGVLARLDAYGPNFISIIEVEGGYWFCAISGGVVATVSGAPGDAFFSSSRVSELSDHVMMFMTMHPDVREWQVYSPDSLRNMVPGLTAIGLPEILRNANAADELKQIVVIGKKAFIAAGLVLAGIAAVSFGVYEYREAQKREAAAEKRRQKRQAEKRDLDEKARLELERSIPWRDKPHPYEFARACEEAIERAYISIPGWSAMRFECRDRSVAITYQSDSFGTPSMLFTATRAYGIRPVLDVTGRTATWSVPLAEVKRRVKEPGQPADAVKELLWEELNNFGIAVNAIPLKLGELPTEKKPNSRQFRMVALNFSASVPLSAFPVFDRIDGLTLDRMSLSMRTMTWEMETKAHDPLN